MKLICVMLWKMYVYTKYLKLEALKLKRKKIFPFVIQLDMRSMYTGGADLSGLLESPAGSLRVSKVIHKAFIDVNEGEI